MPAKSASASTVPADVLAAASAAFDSRDLADDVLPLQDGLSRPDEDGERFANGELGRPAPAAAATLDHEPFPDGPWLVFGSGPDQLWLQAEPSSQPADQDPSGAPATGADAAGALRTGQPEAGPEGGAQPPRRRRTDLWVGGVQRSRVEVALQYARLGIRLVQRGQLPICFTSVQPGLVTVIVQAVASPPGRRRRTAWTHI